MCPIIIVIECNSNSSVTACLFIECNLLQWMSFYIFLKLNCRNKISYVGVLGINYLRIANCSKKESFANALFVWMAFLEANFSMNAY